MRRTTADARTLGSEQPEADEREALIKDMPILFAEPTGRRWKVTEMARTGFGAAGEGGWLPEPTNVLLSYESDGERRVVSGAPTEWRVEKVIEELFFEACREGEDKLTELHAAEIEDFGRRLDAFAASRWGGIRVAASVRREAESLSRRIREELAEGRAQFFDEDLKWLDEHGRGLCDVAKRELKSLPLGEARTQAEGRWLHGCALLAAGVRLRREMYGG